MEMLVRDLSYLVEVRNGLIFLTPLQMCSRDIEMVLGGVGKLPVAELETQFEAKFGRELPLEPLGFDSVTELLMAIPEMSISGRGIRYSKLWIQNLLCPRQLRSMCQGKCLAMTPNPTL